MSEEEKKPQEDDIDTDEQEADQADELLAYTYNPLQMIDMIAPQAQRALIKSSPDKLLEFVEGYDKRQFELALLEEKNQHKEQLNKQESQRFMFIYSTLTAALVFCGSLLYAGVTNDKSLPKDLLTILFSAGGGSGVTYGIIKSQQKQKESEKK